MLSPEVRAAVGIDKEVVVVGNTGRFEIWDADRFKAIGQLRRHHEIFGKNLAELRGKGHATFAPSIS